MFTVARLEHEAAERQKVDQELRHYKAIVECSDDAIFSKTLAGTIVSWNRSAERIYGYSAAEILGRSVNLLVPPDRSAEVRELLQRLERGETVEHFETVGLRKDGQCLHVSLTISPIRHDAGQMVGASTIARDITAAKELQAHRDRLLGRLRLQIERLPLAYILFDPDNRVVDWNPAAEKMFGYTREELVGRVALDWIIPLPANGHTQEILHRIRAGDMEAHVNENRTRDGRIITCEWFNTPLVDADGRFAGAISLAQDVTERKRAEQALESYAARLQALSRRLVVVQEEERRHLARELHDEVGQILTSVTFVLEASVSAPPATAAVRLGEARALIAQALARVRELSFDLRPALLDYLGILPALRGLIESYTASTGVRVSLEQAGLEGRLALELETAAYRVVQEALTNVARHARVKEVAVRLWADANTLTVQVEDQGVGFNQDVLAAGQSSGLLGMRERVTLLGGHLVIESAPGSGTHLLAELPLAGHNGRKIDEHFHRLGR